MKNTFITIVAIIVCGLGCYVSYAKGFEKGFIEKDQEITKSDWFKKCISNESLSDAPAPAKHHYEFKQHEASIFRFDLDTGAACYIQISQADSRGPVQPCPQQ